MKGNFRTVDNKRGVIGRNFKLKLQQQKFGVLCQNLANNGLKVDCKKKVEFRNFSEMMKLVF